MAIRSHTRKSTTNLSAVARRAKEDYQLYSSGFLKFWSLNAKEKRWIGLPMLREFVGEDDEE